MPEEKKVHATIKSVLHPSNKHRERYDFRALIETLPALQEFVFTNKYGDESVDFFNPEAVIMLNKALLKHFYQIDHWEIPENYLCPPIPGRADYIHYIADLIIDKNDKSSNQTKCLDIGVGANCIYPIIGVQEYGWTFVGSDIDPEAIEAAQKIINSNPQLKNKVFLRLQTNRRKIFEEIIQAGEFYDVSICNPPFHASAKEANASSLRKLSNLKGEKVKKATLNFGGQSNELWYEGGELKFLTNMIYESRRFGRQCRWFTSLVSKESNLAKLYKTLDAVNVKSIKTIEMSQGNKISRILAWSFG
ncbi:23S rRNA (adenine(1618)-N(6))-methyltransferase RlmF [Belliella sp. R4-6]|uniref:Ribosomal RNA large subunit methyltransferase F n=1 Tax=Belliella alkalica TaxID=1730871 RepID=A0ABS9VEZ4_9BACT|nr:23S rRNA (adenine(1618)-N(6))-methyltransferase RlmF [Belliella alkalica]MCH7414505.1 23S rRNA (adenine(1618)-N(6))-methyltransferase RlmF [Belliella alkalica]